MSEKNLKIVCLSGQKFTRQISHTAAVTDVTPAVTRQDKLPVRCTVLFVCNEVTHK